MVFAKPDQKATISGATAANPVVITSSEHGLSDSDLVSLHNYKGCDHGFARTGGGNYDKAAAEISDTRTLALLKKSLT